MSHPSFRLLTAAGIISAVGAHQSVKKVSDNDKLMDSVWGTHVTASYRAWQAKHSPSLMDLDAKAAAAYRDWKASKDENIMDMSDQQPAEGDDEEPVGVGQEVAQSSGIGKQTAQDSGIGKAAAQEEFLGRKTAEDTQAGKIAARSEGSGRVEAMKSGEGREIAIAHRAGVKTAKTLGIGNMEAAGQLACAAAPNVSDHGYTDEYRGWFDIQGCGQCNDFCRWVGAGSEGDPFLSQSKNGAYWSCHMAGAEEDYTQENHFDRWMHPRCAGKGEPAVCMDAQSEIVDTGFTDEFQGWYDVQSCGTCNDYCRWVGRSGSGGDPKARLAKGDSWWSCQMAGHTITHTNLGRFGSWGLPRCDGRGAPAPQNSP